MIKNKPQNQLGFIILNRNINKLIKKILNTTTNTLKLFCYYSLYCLGICYSVFKQIKLLFYAEQAKSLIFQNSI